MVFASQRLAAFAGHQNNHPWPDFSAASTELTGSFAACLPSRTSRLRKADVETRPAEFGGAVHFHRAAIRANDVFDDREPDAVPLHALVAAHTALQHAFQLLSGNAG